MDLNKAVPPWRRKRLIVRLIAEAFGLSRLLLLSLYWVNSTPEPRMYLDHEGNRKSNYESKLRSTKHESPHRTIEAPRTPRSRGGGRTITAFIFPCETFICINVEQYIRMWICVTTVSDFLNFKNSRLRGIFLTTRDEGVRCRTKRVVGKWNRAARI